MKYANAVQLTAGKESVLGAFLVRMRENTNLKSPNTNTFHSVTFRGILIALSDI